MKKTNNYVGADVIIVPPKDIMTLEEAELFFKGYTPIKRRWLNIVEVLKLAAPSKPSKGGKE